MIDTVKWIFYGAAFNMVYAAVIDQNLWLAMAWLNGAAGWGYALSQRS